MTNRSCQPKEEQQQPTSSFPTSLWQSDMFQAEQHRKLIDYKLSDIEQFVLSHGLSFCLLLSSIKYEEVLADFEVLYAQPVHHKPLSIEQLAALKARCRDLAHAYCRSPIDFGDFLMTKECSDDQVPSDE